ncbi:MAG: helix-turn-helix domain-containing protein [Isosphaeraceae bacterium]
MRMAPRIALEGNDRLTLEAWVAAEPDAPRRASRARIVLLASGGKTNIEIAQELGLDRRVVGRWRHRFAVQGLMGILREAPRQRRPSPIRDRLTRLILDTTLNRQPTSGSRWTTRSLAAELGVSRCRVDRVWRANGIRMGEPVRRLQAV